MVKATETHPISARIAELEEVRSDIRSMLEAAEYEAKASLDDLDSQIDAVRRQCSHTYPDGISADDGGFMFGMCKICGTELS